MEIKLIDTGKRFNRNWIFKHVNFNFTPENKYVILGSNGSGKSTMLQMIAGNVTPSEGTIVYSDNSKIIAPDKIYTNIAIAAPYLDLIEAYTLQEIVEFHFRFKQFHSGILPQDFVEIAGLKINKHKYLKEFSSGMKQRIKLALAILSNTPVLLLDEPLSNLDSNGVSWYKELMKIYTTGRLVLICSNRQKDEYEFCNIELNVEDFNLLNRHRYRKLSADQPSRHIFGK